MIIASIIAILALGYSVWATCKIHWLRQQCSYSQNQTAKALELADSWEKLYREDLQDARQRP